MVSAFFFFFSQSEKKYYNSLGDQLIECFLKKCVNKPVFPYLHTSDNNLSTHDRYGQYKNLLMSV